MLNRRTFLKTSTAVAAVSGFGIRTALANEDLRWSIHCDLTGPAAEGGKFQADGFNAYADWVNANGGIRGRKIALSINDSTFKVDVAVANVKKELAKGRIDFLFGESTGMIHAISPENNSTQKIFMTSGSFASELADEKAFPYHFVTGATYGAQLRMLVDHIKSASGSTPARVVIVHSSTAMGRDGIEVAMKRAQELGVNIVLVQQTRFVETDVSAFALAIRQARPTHVIHHGYSFAVWPEIVRLCRDYGMRDVVFLGTIWQNERAKMRDLREVADGLIGIKCWNDDTANPAGDMMRTIGQVSRQRDAAFSGFARLGFLNAWMSGMMATKAFEAVIDAKLPITGDNLSNAMRAVKDWNTGGLIDVPVTVSGQQLGLGRMIRWTRKDGNPQLEQITDWIKVN